MTQHDWKKLGFTVIEEKGGKGEGALQDSFVDANKVEAQADENLPNAGATSFFQELYKEIDTDDKDGVTPDEIQKALKDPELSERINKIIAYHPTEWKDDSKSEKWKRLGTEFLKGEENKPLLQHEQKRIDDLIFWGKVRELSNTPKVYHFNPIMFISYLNEEVVFPLKVKPRNDKGGRHSNFYWAIPKTNDKGASMAIYGWRRGGGRRLHAARDLYTDNLAEVVAICNGKVLSVSSYYKGTSEVTVLHKTLGGREFIVRYGEVDRNSITVVVGDYLMQGEVFAKVGYLHSKNSDGTTIPLLKIEGHIIYMLHFEFYTGYISKNDPENFNIPPKNTRGEANANSYQRRKDITDPLAIFVMTQQKLRRLGC